MHFVLLEFFYLKQLVGERKKLTLKIIFGQFIFLENKKLDPVPDLNKRPWIRNPGTK